MSERRFLTREELGRLLADAPPKWRPLFELLACTGLRISEAIALRWSDLHLDPAGPHLQVIRAVVKGVLGAPKSRHGRRLVPLSADLAGTLRSLRPDDVADDAFVFAGRDGGPSDPGALRRRALVPAATRAGLSGVGFHTLRHTWRVHVDRVRVERTAVAAVDGPSLAGVHDRGLRPPARPRPPRATARPRSRAPRCDRAAPSQRWVD